MIHRRIWLFVFTLSLLCGIAFLAALWLASNWAARGWTVEKADLPHLITDLQHPHPDVRWGAAFKLGVLGLDAEPAIPELIHALDDRDPRVRAAVATALGAIGPHAETAVPHLILRLHDPNHDARSAAVLALAKMGPAATDALPELARLAQDPSLSSTSGVRTAQDTIAAYDIKLTVDTAAEVKERLPQLIQQLTDPNPIQRYLAVTLLGELGSDSREAFRPISSLLVDSKQFVRRAAAKALRRIDPEQARKLLPEGAG